MAEENKNNSLGWHFWFLVSFSLFLIVTFTLYLPLRFEYQTFKDVGGHMMEEMEKRGSMTGGRHDGGAVGHGQNLYHEESNVREGLAVNFNITPVPVLSAQARN